MTHINFPTSVDEYSYDDKYNFHGCTQLKEVVKRSTHHKTQQSYREVPSTIITLTTSGENKIVYKLTDSRICYNLNE